MATLTAIPTTEQGTALTVRTCYDLLTVVHACGLTDLTDGKYVDDRNNRASYRAAQERQAEFLLDRVGCGRGTRLLDIGCGYGRILEHAARRGADAVGITVARPQVARCRAAGLAVYELNYRNVFAGGGERRLTLTNPPLTPPYKGGEFEAIVANGSLEHFVQAADAAAGRADEIYAEMFAICRRLLIAGGRFVTTAIHFCRAEQFDPAEILRGAKAHPRGTPNYQYAALVESFGGWYPEPGQLERCAAEHFELVHEEDGTRDYHLTSEYWQRRFRQRLCCDPRVWWALGREFVRHPGPAWRMFRLQLWDQSWPWQFRDPAPMRLLRQTWRAK